MLDVDTKLIDKEVVYLLNKYAPDKEHRLLVTVTLERLTYLMGVILPRFKKVLFKQNEIAHMWIRHGVEELQHVHVGERLMKEECNFGFFKQAKYMYLGISTLIGYTTVLYKRLKEAEKV